MHALRSPHGFALTLLLTCTLALAGCDSAGGLERDEGVRPGLRSSAAADAPSTTRIGNYDVTFNGREVDRANPGVIKFRYTVTGTGAGAPLDNFFLEVPSCAGVPFVFAESFLGTNEQSGLSGVTWLEPLPANGSREYVVAFFSDVPTGTVRAGTTTGGVQTLGQVPGPCGSVAEARYAVSGTVYVDADADATRDGEESGVPGVRVLLTNGAVTLTATTDGTGAYGFNAPAGAYTLSVPASSGGAAFNEGLFAYYAYTGSGSAEQAVTVGAAVSGKDFGFALRVQAVIQALRSGEVATDTEDAHFWTRQMRAASKGHQPHDETLSALAGYLTRLEGLLLREPFQFGAGNKFAVALKILDPPTRTPYDVYLQQLLTAELNVVSGRGSTSEAFNTALLAYGEAVAVSTRPTTLRMQSRSATAAAELDPATLDEATVVLDTFNRSGGGTTRPR